MRINLMRTIDYYLGPVFCKLLLFLRLFSGSKRPPKNTPLKENCKNILIMKFFGMGSILLASPALRELKNKCKSAKITIFTLSSNRKLCEMLDSIDSVFCLDINNALGFLKSLITSIFDIRRRNFDVIINLEFLSNFSAFVTLAVTLFEKPKIVIGFNSPFNWRNIAHNITVCFDHSKHITKIFAKMISSISGDVFEPSLERERANLLEKMDAEYMKNLIKSNNDLAHCSFFSCVNINATELSLHRRWPREYFAKIINEMIKRPDVAILLIGGKADAEYVSEFKKSLTPSSRIMDVSGKTNIKELIGLFAGSNLLITNDSGPLHIAEIIGLPTISFFGPETPCLYGPLDSRHYVFYQDLYCSPCLSIYNSKTSRCRNNICLKTIRPERVLEVIENKYLSEEKDK